MPQTRNRRSRKDTRDRFQPPLARWQAAGLGPLNWLAPTVVEHMSDLGSEWLSFVATRVREDVALQHALLHARSPEDAQAVQLAFLQKAMDQYSAETGRMIELSSRLFDPADAPDPDDDDDRNVNV